MSPPVFTLTRTEETEDGVFGVMVGPGLRKTGLHTMEDDWRANRRGLSCIPAGRYILSKTIFHKHGYETYEITGVPNRSRILIHPANTEEDVEGCVGLGLSRGFLQVARDEDTKALKVSKRAVLSSKEAFRQFMAALDGTPTAVLNVVWADGLPITP